MDELVNLIVARTGVDQQTALTAAQTVIGFLKDRLPAPVGQQLEAFAGGQVNPGMMNQGQDLLGGLGGMLGGNKT